MSIGDGMRIGKELNDHDNIWEVFRTWIGLWKTKCGNAPYHPCKIRNMKTYEPSTTCPTFTFTHTHTHQRGRLEIQSLSAQVYGGNRISTPSTTSDVPWRFQGGNPMGWKLMRWYELKLIGSFRTKWSSKDCRFLYQLMRFGSRIEAKNTKNESESDRVLWNGTQDLGDQTMETYVSFEGLPLNNA